MMYKQKTTQDEEKENKIYKSLLHVFGNEVLRDFQEHISKVFELPSSLWVYDRDNKLKPLLPRETFAFYPEFCKNIHKYFDSNDAISFCHSRDSNIISEFLSNFKETPKDDAWQIINCHMGISRIVFPLIVNEEVVGALAIGKFVDKKNESVVSSIVNDLLRDLDKAQGVSSDDVMQKKCNKNEILESIKLIPGFTHKNAKQLATKVQNLIPLIKTQYARFQVPEESNDPIFNGFLFLETLDYKISDIFLSYDALWSRVDEILKKLVDKLNLQSGIVFFTDRSDYQRLIPLSQYPAGITSTKDLSMDSMFSLRWLEYQQRGVLLPIKEGPLVWLNDYLEKIFKNDTAIVYAAEVFPQKIVLIGFGFKQYIFLSDFEKLLLRIGVFRLMKFIGNVISQIELDQIIVETGHKLRLTYGDIKGGINSLNKYGYSEKDASSEDVATIIKLSKEEIDSGLSQLDLITRNYHAFTTIVPWLPKKDASEYVNGFETIDLIKLLKDFEDVYRVQLIWNEMSIKYDFDKSMCLIKGIEPSIKLLFWNLFDNAVKFAYRGTYIHVRGNTVDNFYEIKISNRGVGIPPDEIDKVFDKFAKSLYSDPKKARVGQGLGLAICRRCIDMFFPEGDLSIHSEPAPKKHGKREFPGDNFLTTVTVKIPINGAG